MDSELVVSRLAGSTWAVLREHGASVELHVEDGGDEPRVGRIVKARVDAIQPSLQAAFLTIDGGRRAFLQAFERRMAQEVTHPVFQYRISYRRVLEVQARVLARVIVGELPSYPSFRTR